MKVSNLNSENQALQYINQAAKGTQPEQKTGVQEGSKIPGAVDKVEISSQSRDLQKIREVLELTPDVRSEKVAALKKAIDKGTYQIKAEDIADKMLKEIIMEINR